jgi:hypothetical protein
MTNKPLPRGQYDSVYGQELIDASDTGEAEPVALPTDEEMREGFREYDWSVSGAKNQTPWQLWRDGAHWANRRIINAATPAAPGEVTDAQIIEWAIEEQFLLFCDEEDVVQIVRSAFQKWAGLAALSNPAPVAAPAQSEVEALTRLNATLGLKEADATIAMSNADVRIRRLMAEAAPAPASEAVAQSGHAVIEAALLEAAKNDPSNSPIGLWGTAAVAFQMGLAAAYQHALEMIPTPGDSADAPVQQAGEAK